MIPDEDHVQVFSPEEAHPLTGDAVGVGEYVWTPSGGVGLPARVLARREGLRDPKSVHARLNRGGLPQAEYRTAGREKWYQRLFDDVSATEQHDAAPVGHPGSSGEPGSPQGDQADASVCTDPSSDRALLDRLDRAERDIAALKGSARDRRHDFAVGLLEAHQRLLSEIRHVLLPEK